MALAGISFTNVKACKERENLRLTRQVRPVVIYSVNVLLPQHLTVV